MASFITERIMAKQGGDFTNCIYWEIEPPFRLKKKKQNYLKLCFCLKKLYDWFHHDFEPYIRHMTSDTNLHHLYPLWELNPGRANAVVTGPTIYPRLVYTFEHKITRLKYIPTFYFVYIHFQTIICHLVGWSISGIEPVPSVKMKPLSYILDYRR